MVRPPECYGPVCVWSKQKARDVVEQWFAGITGGLNIERELMAEFSQDEHNYLRKQLPTEIARVFVPWRPQGGYAFNENTTWQVLSDTAVSRFVDGLVKMRNAGYKRVIADCADVCEDTDLSDRGFQLIGETCRKIARACKDRGLGADFLALGAINEWACTRERVHALQDPLAMLIRQELPQHIISYGPNYWKSHEMITKDDSYVPIVDELSFCDAHAYIAWDDQGFHWLAGMFAAWEQRTGRRLIFGEAGPGQLQRDEMNYSVYPNTIRRMMPIMRRHVPMTWSVNKAGHWRLNHNGAELMNGQSYPEGGNAPMVLDALRQALDLS